MSLLSPISSLLSLPAGRVSRLAHRLASVLALVSTAAGVGCGEGTTAPVASGNSTAPTLRSTRAATADYSIEDLGTLGGTTAAAYAINASGAVIGTSKLPGDLDAHGFLWQGSVMTDLGSLRPAGINRTGEIAGWSTLASVGLRAVRWTDGVLQNLGTLGGDASQAFGINDFGMIVGSSQTGTGDRHAFVWEDGVMTDIGTIGGTSSVATAVNHHGVVVGWSGTAAGEVHAFRWQHGVMEDLGALGRQGSVALAVNAKGDIVGELGPRLDAEGGEREDQTPFLLSHNGTLTDLGLVPNMVLQSGRALGINQQDVVVGSAEFLRLDILSIPWVKQGGMTAPLPELPRLSEGTGSEALAINQAGDIVGYSQGRAVMWHRKRA